MLVNDHRPQYNWDEMLGLERRRGAGYRGRNPFRGDWLLVAYMGKSNIAAAKHE
jgi:hypothetical protein